GCWAVWSWSSAGRPSSRCSVRDAGRGWPRPGEALLYAGLAGYLVALVRRRPGAGCGPLAANELTVTRAVVLAFAGLVVVVLPYALRPASSADALLTWGTVVVLAALLAVADARQRSRRVCV
ncbi:hypothetical protein TR74_12765, partial [Carbonactinospora thermoautotrophica]